LRPPDLGLSFGLAIRRLVESPSPFPLWLVDASCAPASAAERILSSAERGRAERFHHQWLRDRYIAAHCGLRLVLEHCFGVPATRQSFGSGASGKPYLEGVPRAQFSLSYSGKRVLIAVAADVPVGVDIERLRTIDGAADLVRVFGTRSEQALLERCDPASTRFDRVFLEIWTRKEACLKATGFGLAAMDLCEIESGAGAGLKTVRVGFCQLRTDTTLVEDGFIAAWAAGNVPVSY
jgi:4'-phosphopantetheinyl transferase